MNAVERPARRELVKMKWILLPALVTGIFVVGCFSRSYTHTRPLPTVSSVDLKRYGGKWYEVARLPNSFQKDDETATAEYTPQQDGSIRVENTAVKPDGATRDAKGRAEAVSGSNNARLRVKFEGLASLVPVSSEGNYWIIALDERNYRYAVVGTPDRKFLWILAREPHLDRDVTAKLVQRARELGFPVEKLIWRKA